MMKRCKQITIILTAAIIGLSSAWGEGVGHLMSGVPIYEGLSEDVDQGVVFDKPEGRILEARFSGEVTARAVLAFYTESMPPIGWQLIESHKDRMTFEREDERLHITLEEIDNGLSVSFFISPKNADES